VGVKWLLETEAVSTLGDISLVAFALQCPLSKVYMWCIRPPSFKVSSLPLLVHSYIRTHLYFHFIRVCITFIFVSSSLFCLFSIVCVVDD